MKRTPCSPQSLSLTAAAALMLALTLGCGSDESGGEGADTVSASDSAASPQDGDADGAALPDGGGAEDSAGGALFSCSVDADCEGAGEICDCHGECVVVDGAACAEDKNCGVPNWCDDCTGHCEAQATLCGACELSRACEDGACVPYSSGGTFCGQECLTDIGCPIGYSCLAVTGVDVKQCIAKSGDCRDLGVCRDDGDCPDGDICNATLGECGQGCVEGGCTLGKVCVLGRCSEPCGGDEDCTAPAECTAEGRCKIPGSCESKVDCPDPETYCDKVEGMCKDGCLVDNDCGDAAKECEGRSCVPKGCEHNYQCQFSYECEQASGACAETTDAHCEPCGDSGSYPCEEPELCVTFQDEDENPLGDFCLIPCKEDPIDKCPSGYQCQAIEIDGEEKHYCARQCYVDPVAIGGAQ